jgi:hypothetical protein
MFENALNAGATHVHAGSVRESLPMSNLRKTGHLPGTGISGPCWLDECIGKDAQIGTSLEVRGVNSVSHYLSGGSAQSHSWMVLDCSLRTEKCCRA